jgi:hypothetical protein
MNPAWLSAWVALLSMGLSTVAVLFAASRRFRDPELRSLRSSVAGLRAGLDEATQIIHQLNERDRMRRVRARESSSSPTQPGNPTDKPDPQTNPEGWKRWMRQHQPAGVR